MEIHPEKKSKVPECLKEEGTGRKIRSEEESGLPEDSS